MIIAESLFNIGHIITYKTYKNLFEAIKPKSKKNYYSQKMLQLKYDIKKRWNVMKEIIGKAKYSKKSNFPQKLKIGKT